MAEYIEREAAKQFLAQDYAYAAAKLLDYIPAADVAEVRHGEWVKKETHSVCSECGNNVISWSGECGGYERERGISLMHYCPHCGAKMDGKGRNT